MASSSGKNADELGKWLRSPRPPRDGLPELRLFCFPPAGSGYVPFSALERAAGDWAECITVQFPGHGPRIHEIPARSFRELAEGAADAIVPAVAGSPVPYVLLGYSMGGIAAYEVASRLDRSASVPPVRVVVASANAPQEVARQAGSAEPSDPLEFLRRMGAPDELFASAELLELTVRALHTDWMLLRSYRFSAQVLRAPLSVLYGSGDDLINRRSLASWTGLSIAGVVVREFAGGHRFLDSRYGELLGELRREAAGRPR
jgi:surfactin synthase thioesterase subunit